jgi:hypothetical protein
LFFKVEAETAMSLLLVIRFLHILSAIWFIGGVLARQIVRLYAKRTDDVRHFSSMSQAAGRIENTMVIPGNFAAILFGVIYGLMIGAILGFLQGRAQLAAGQQHPACHRLLQCSVDLPARQLDAALLMHSPGEMTPNCAHINDPVVRMAHWFELVAMLVVVFLMVFRPF